MNVRTSKFGRKPITADMYEKQALQHEAEIEKLEVSKAILKNDSGEHTTALGLIDRQLSLHTSRALGCRKMKARLLEGWKP